MEQAGRRWAHGGRSESRFPMTAERLGVDNVCPCTCCFVRALRAAVQGERGGRETCIVVGHVTVCDRGHGKRGERLAQLWDTLPCVWDTLQCVWDTLPCVGDTLQCVWDTLPCVGDTLQCVWHTLPCVGDTLQCVWDTLPCVGDTLQCVWDTLPCVGDTLQCVWDTLPCVGDTLQCVTEVTGKGAGDLHSCGTRYRVGGGGHVTVCVGHVTVCGGHVTVCVGHVTLCDGGHGKREGLRGRGWSKV